MGCDIHCFTEKKIKGVWTSINGFTSDHYKEGDEYFGKEEFKNASSPLDGRNYNLFAILANVRNGAGFAGCDTRDTIFPISMPKGLPSDLSESIRKESNEWGCDGHSHSWLLVKEIMNYDEKQKQINRGFVTVNEYKEFLKHGKPTSWCGGVGGGLVEIVKQEEIIEYQKQNPNAHAYCKIEWETTLYESAKWLFKNALEQLMVACDSKSFDDVRIVFWFDN